MRRDRYTERVQSLANTRYRGLVVIGACECEICEQRYHQPPSTRQSAKAVEAMVIRLLPEIEDYSELKSSLGRSVCSALQTGLSEYFSWRTAF